MEGFLNLKFPTIQRVAQKMGADIAVEDETGIGLPTRSGRTWGEVNSPPTVTVNQQRGGYNVLSAITAKGALRFDIEEKSINGKRYIAFLEKIPPVNFPVMAMIRGAGQAVRPLPTY